MFLTQYPARHHLAPYTDNHTSLGHRRLSIIDLRTHGRQPMASPDNAIQIVFNGEIYNFQELRQTLTAKGYTFRTKTDTEVLLQAYQHFGHNMLKHLNGMFAFCIYDSHDQSYFLARDRVGIKPLYYTNLQLDSLSHLIFASEIKAILACPKVSREIDPQSLHQYIGYEFTSAPPAPSLSISTNSRLPPT